VQTIRAWFKMPAAILPVSPCRKRSSLPSGLSNQKSITAAFPDISFNSCGESASFVVEALELLAPLHFLLHYPGRRKRFGRLRPISHIMHLRKLEPLDQEFFPYPPRPEDA
jgi:hypothetical protein